MGDKIRKYGRSLQGTIAPVSALSPQSANVRRALVPTVMASAETHDDAIESTNATAKAAKINAPTFLVSTTRMIARIVSSQIHDADTTGPELATAMQKSTETYLSGMQKSLVNTQKELQKTEADLKAVRKVTEATDPTGTGTGAAGDAGAGQPGAGAAGGGATPADNDAQDPPPADPKAPSARGLKKSRTFARKTVPAMPSPEVAQAANADAAANDDGKAAEAEVKEEQNRLALLEELVLAARKCGDLNAVSTSK